MKVSPGRQKNSTPEELGDFTATVRVIPIALIAIFIGVVASYVAWFLLKLIGLFTNIFYYQRFDTTFHRRPATIWAFSRSQFR